LSAVTNEVTKAAPQRRQSAAALIRPKQSVGIVAEPMPLPALDKPQPTPHREAIREGVAFPRRETEPDPTTSLRRRHSAPRPESIIRESQRGWLARAVERAEHSAKPERERSDSSRRVPSP
jgi:hypothetical protein